MMIDLSLSTISVSLGIVTVGGGFLFYIGDTRWLRRKDWHEKNNCEALIIANIQKVQVEHEEALTNGKDTMNRLEGMISEQGRNISNVSNGVSRIEGMMQVHPMNRVSGV